jgi:AcrR family transcriptional regulator
MELTTDTRAYRQQARARASERTRQALLDAAEREFFSGRWEQGSLESIAARAHVTKQTLLRHFGSREGLLEQAVRRSASTVRDERWAAPSGDIGGAIDNLIEHYERWGERALRIGAVDGPGELGVELARSARELHYEWVEHAFGPWLNGVRGKARTRLRAVLIAVCDVHTWWLLSHDLGLPRDELRATLVKTIKQLTQEAK